MTFALAALLLSLAAPSLYGMIQRKRVVGAAEELRADLRIAQRMAMGSVAPSMAVHFAGDATEACYVVYATLLDSGMAECSCRNSPPCSGTGLTMVKKVSFDPSNGIKLVPMDGTATLSDAIVVFRKSDGVLSQGIGYLTALTVALDAGGGGQLRIKVDAAGRSLLCTADGRHAGYPAC